MECVVELSPINFTTYINRRTFIKVGILAGKIQIPHIFALARKVPEGALLEVKDKQSGLSTVQRSDRIGKSTYRKVDFCSKIILDL